MSIAFEQKHLVLTKTLVVSVVRLCFDSFGQGRRTIALPNIDSFIQVGDVM